MIWSKKTDDKKLFKDIFPRFELLNKDINYNVSIYMSDLSEIPIEQKEMLNKLNKLNKTLKEYSNKLDENKNKLAKVNGTTNEKE